MLTVNGQLFIFNMANGREAQVLEVIWEWGGEASIDRIARETDMSTDYVRLVCENLGRNDYIDFMHSKLCRLRSKGKIEAQKIARSKPKKTVVSQGYSRASYDKRKRLIMGY
jgi:hypothetical protein